MRRLILMGALAASTISAVGCAWLPGGPTLSDLRGGSASTTEGEIQTVGHRTAAADESVLLESDPPPDQAGVSGWKRLLNPFRNDQRIPLPLSPKTAEGDPQPELNGF